MATTSDLDRLFVETWTPRVKEAMDQRSKMYEMWLTKLHLYMHNPGMTGVIMGIGEELDSAYQLPEGM